MFYRTSPWSSSYRKFFEFKRFIFYVFLTKRWRGNFLKKLTQWIPKIAIYEIAFILFLSWKAFFSKLLYFYLIRTQHGNLGSIRTFSINQKSEYVDARVGLMICDWFPQFLVISAKTDKFLVKRRFKQDNTFSWKGIARSFFNPLSYLSLFFFLSMIEAVQPSTSMQERKAYPWGCPYHSCRGPFQRGLPPHRSFSGPHRGFSHGPSYRPPLRPPVRRNSDSMREKERDSMRETERQHEGNREKNMKETEKQHKKNGLLNKCLSISKLNIFSSNKLSS